MTGSGWIDLIIVLVVVAVSSGLRQGAVASALAFFGVVLGAVAGILIAPHVLVHVDDGNMRLLAGVALIVVLVIVGEVAGMVLGRAARSGMHSPVARGVDSVVGAVLQAGAVLVAAWLLAIPLTASPQTQLSAVREVPTSSGRSTTLPRIGCAASHENSRRCWIPRGCPR